MGKRVAEDWGRVRSSGYGIVVVKTTDPTTVAEQTALSGATRRPPTAQTCQQICCVNAACRERDGVCTVGKWATRGLALKVNNLARDLL